MDFTRAKRVSDPLAEEVRARLVGCDFKSSSESSGDGFDDDESPCLSALLQRFFEDDDEIATVPRGRENDSGSDSDSDTERVSSVAERSNAAEEIATSVKNCLIDDSYGRVLLAHVARATDVLSSIGSRQEQRAVFFRNFVSFLRELGHNAAICRTKWSSSGGLTAGTHEFIDVVKWNQSRDATCRTVRYIVDLDFASQFEIARPTSQYARVLQSLPRVFVGREDALKRIVRLTCDAARRSLRSRGLTCPPWRKNRYLQTRWLGPYKRTINLSPSSHAVNPVMCRAVGFDNAVGARLFVRTR